MLGGEAPFGLVELGHARRGAEEGLEQRDLAILVEVALGVGERVGEILPKAGVVLLFAAAGGCDDHPIGPGQLAEERRA